LKEPHHGALGGLPVETIAEIVSALRTQRIKLPISATIGDLPMSEIDAIRAKVEAVGACGVDYVKVGIERVPGAVAVLDALAASGRPVVPVFIADRGLDFGHVDHACRLGFPGIMVDTEDKAAGGLFDVMSIKDLYRFTARVRETEALLGMAGRLRIAHLPALRDLAPDFAGFRSAVCVSDRRDALDEGLLHRLAKAIHVDDVPEEDA
jgi:uncharacterized protein (UPF0264 family)